MSQSFILRDTFFSQIISSVFHNIVSNFLNSNIIQELVKNNFIYKIPTKISNKSKHTTNLTTKLSRTFERKLLTS